MEWVLATYCVGMFLTSLWLRYHSVKWSMWWSVVVLWPLALGLILFKFCLQTYRDLW